MTDYYYNAASRAEADYILRMHEASAHEQHMKALARNPAMMARHQERKRQESLRGRQLDFEQKTGTAA